MHPKAAARQAQLHLDTAETTFEAGGYEACVSRSYYAMHYLARALVAQKTQLGHDHPQVHWQFYAHFTDEEQLSREHAKMLAAAFALRQKSRMAKELVVSREEASRTLENARAFVEAAAALLLANAHRSK